VADLPPVLNSLQRRRRGRPLVAIKRRLTDPTQRRSAILRELAATRRALEASEQRMEALRADLAALAPLDAIPLLRPGRPTWYPPGSVTRGFAAQLDGWEPDLSAVDADIRDMWEGSAPENRAYLDVMLAVWQDAPGFCERTGLRRADPPEDVHAMARGPLAAGGGFSAADLVADTLEAVGQPLSGTSRALDFGGSSGRVVRVLQAAFPAIEWHSCDPNEDAIAWAREHLPGTAFHVSPDQPPLGFPDAHFDLVYAVSVWSHLSEAAAARWLDEMRRVIRPGGALLLTLHSWESTRHLAANGLWDLHDVRQSIADMYVRGHHFRHTFGPDGDSGVQNPDWGQAMMSPEWLLERLTPAWELLSWRSGRHEGDQDVVVFRRRREPEGPLPGGVEIEVRRPV
jgi:SAM-dependent methyltransferase